MAYNKEWYEQNKARVAEQRRSKRTSTDTSAIVCRFCSVAVAIRGLTRHLRLHNISFDDYVEQHFDDFVAHGYERCFWCKEGVARRFKCQDKINSFCSQKCSSAWMATSYIGQECTNKGYRWTPEQKEKQSRLLSGRPGKAHTDSTKISMKNSALKRASAPDYVNPMQGRTHSPESIAKIMTHRKRTKLELLTANVLTAQGFGFTEQFFLSRDGRCYSYDFNLSGSHVIIEVDGDYWHGGPGAAKHHRDVNATRTNDLAKTNFAEEHGFIVVRVWESEMKRNPKILLDRLAL